LRVGPTRRIGSDRCHRLFVRPGEPFAAILCRCEPI
jgi:hypothetical protein